MFFLDYFYGEARKYKSYIECMHYHIEEINQRLTTSFATYEKAQLIVNIVNNEYKTVLNKAGKANFNIEEVIGNMEDSSYDGGK